MALERQFEQWGRKKVGNFEITPQALWPILKLLMKRDGPKAPVTAYGPVGITYYPNKKAKMIVDCLENQFTSHDLCDENHG
jgi:hypothetical protein